MDFFYNGLNIILTYEIRTKTVQKLFLGLQNFVFYDSSSSALLPDDYVVPQGSMHLSTIFFKAHWDQLILKILILNVFCE